MNPTHASLAAAALAAALLSTSCGGHELVDPATRAERAANLIFASNPTDAQMKEGFLHLLDAVAETAARDRFPIDFVAKITEARSRIHDTAPADERAVALIHECYRDLHDGAAFQMPETIGTLADVTREGRQRLESIRALLLRGESVEAASRMLEAALCVMTPIERRLP
jgi:hypothetical protein